MGSSKLRIGVAGFRGTAYMDGLRALPEANIVAFCETDPERRAQVVQNYEIPLAFDSYIDMLDAVDAVVIATPMQLHVPQSIMALQAGKHVFCEVTAAVTLDECWRLLDAVEASGKTYMMAENYCYFHNNMIVRAMVQEGLFGDLYFGCGEYVHEVRSRHHTAEGDPTWRYYWQVGVNGCTYGTHSLGPVLQWFQTADPQDRVDYVICKGSGQHTDPEHPHDDTSLMLCVLKSGKLISIRLDMMSNRPHLGNYYTLQGTKGVFETSRDGKEVGQVWVGENRPDENREWRPLLDFEYLLPAEWHERAKLARQAGHGGTDYHVSRAFVESVVTGCPPAIGIYDALDWTAPGLCSQVSIANGGIPIRVPDFRDRRQRPVTLDAPLLRI